MLGNISKSEIKLIQALGKKKFRQKYNKFIAEGDKICFELCQQDKISIDKLFVTQKWVDSNPSVKQSYTIVTSEDLKAVSSLSAADSALAIVSLPVQKAQLEDLSDWCLVLDRVQDPGNMGTLLRIADWFGIKQVVCAIGSVDVYNTKVVQASMGAFLRLDIHQGVVLEQLLDSTGLPIYAGLLDGAPLLEVDKSRPGYILMGNESQGIADNLRQYVTHPVYIRGGGGAESLNVGVAAGIICHHLLTK